MKDVGNITRVMPDKRVDALMKFRKRLADNPKVSVVKYDLLQSINDMF
jgi:hypothetical protein